MIEGNVKSVRRIEDYNPLLDILAELKGSSDPYLKFQAGYAWQALQFVGDDESPLHAVVRIGGGMTKAVLGVASVFNFDPDNLCNGLHELGLATGQAYDVMKANVDGAMDSVLTSFRSGTKQL
ncbi:hypothetical protein BGX24_008163, partial [Mortierella sp. AD032]